VETKRASVPKKVKPIQRRGLHIFLITAAIVLAILGQVELLKRIYIAGGVLYAFAILAFIFSARPNPSAEITVGTLPKLKISAPPILLLTSFMISFVICDMVRSGIQFPSSALVIPLGWALSILLFIIGVLHGSGWRFPVLRKMISDVKSHRIEIGLLSLILLGAFTSRIILISSHPYAFANDEGLIALDAIRLQTNEMGSIFAVSSAAMPMLNFLPTLISVDIFGRTVAAVRLASVLEGVLTVLFVYLAAKEAFGKRVALIAAAVLAFLPVHMHFSRTGFNTILFSFYASLLVWLVLRAIRTGRISSYLLAGLAGACAFFTHMGAWIAIAFTVGILGYFVFFRKDYLRQSWIHLLVFFFAMGIVIAPQTVFFVKNPHLFAARLNAVGVFQSGWLSTQIATTGKSAVYLLGSQFLKSTLAFISLNTPYGFYNTPNPYFMPLAAIFLVLGMGSTILRLRKPSDLFLFAWFWSVIILGGMLTTDAPATHRLVAALPAAAILVGIGLDQTALTLARIKFIPRRIGSLLIGLAVLVIAVYGVKFYFVDYRQYNWYGDHSNEVEFESTRIMQQLGKDYQLVLLGEPELAANFPNYVFLLNGYTRKDLAPGSAFPVSEAPEKTLFVTIPSRKEELEAIAQSLPGGSWLDLQRRWASNEALFSAYIFPAARVSLYAAHAHPMNVASKRFTLPIWTWWVAAILASIVLDLWVLPLVWRRLVKKERPRTGAPWKWFSGLGKKLHWWLEE
jgi:4-amino-4-deoxy-L-arabinose transferase-like glycosyltransferase